MYSKFDLFLETLEISETVQYTLIELYAVFSVFKIGATLLGYFPCIRFCWSIAFFFLAVRARFFFRSCEIFFSL